MEYHSSTQLAENKGLALTYLLHKMANYDYVFEKRNCGFLKNKNRGLLNLTRTIPQYYVYICIFFIVHYTRVHWLCNTIRNLCNIRKCISQY